MSSYLTSLFNYLSSFLPPQEADPNHQIHPEQQQHQHQRAPTPNSNNPQRQENQQPKDQEQQQQPYPRTPSDITLAINHLNRASSPRLPAELLKQILTAASYDSITYTSTSSTPVNAIARTSAGPPARACVTSPALTHLGPSTTTTASSSNHHSLAPAESTTFPAGRIRKLSLTFTGRDQGWTSDPNTASWSWFEIGKFSPSSSYHTLGSSPSQQQSSSSSPSPSTPIERGPLLSHNAIAGQSWQDFSITYHIDPLQCSSNVTQELREWIETLQKGDQVVIIPMARFAGWQCRILRARVEVEVEVWY